jgi:hypothetical protein
MALTPAEKQRLYRSRKKEAHQAAPDITNDYMRRPFSEFLADYPSDFEGNLDYVGVDFRGDLFDEVQKFRSDFDREGMKPLRGNSLDRVSAVAQIFLDVSVELHKIINEYKLAEIDARIAEIEASDLADPQVRKAGVADIVKLSQIRAELDREFRRSFREIGVKRKRSP